jgi:hypothetical protein
MSLQTTQSTRFVSYTDNVHLQVYVVRPLDQMYEGLLRMIVTNLVKPE